MVTNLFTNPDMVATDGDVVVWENLAHINAQRGTAFWTPVSGAPINADHGTHISNHPLGLETAVLWSYKEGQGQNSAAIVRANNIDGLVLPSDRIKRTVGYWVMSEAPGLRVRRGGSSAPLDPDPLRALVWRWVEQEVSEGEIASLIVEVPQDRWGDPNIRVWTTGTVVWTDTPPPFPHYIDYSPDPDLTPQERPGRGSQLVGQRVAGLAATNGVVVQSEQWAKSRGVSGRIINNTGSPVTVALDDASVFTRLWTYDGAKETLATLASPSVIPGPDTLGESKWVDLITSTAQRYDGPLFSGSTPNSADDSGYGWVYEWVGAPDASASMREFTQVNDTAVRVVEDLDAPAVGITVEGLSSVETSRIAIYRQTPGKERTLVQGLGNVDVDGAGYWVDYLPPLGVPVTYVVEVLEGDPLEENSATITIPSSTAWLQDALNPLLAVEVACRPGNRDTLFFTAEAFTAFERPTNSDLVQIMGGRVPVGMTSRRQTPVGIPFNMVTTAAEASSMLREVLIEGTHLVLRVPPEISMLDPVTYLSDVQVSEEPGRQSFLGGHVIRWNMTGSQTRGPRIVAWTALWTYDDVAELYAGYSYIDLVDGRRYVDWQAAPDEAQLAGFSTTSGGSNA